MYVVVWHANDAININTWMDGRMDGCMDGWMGGCECKLNPRMYLLLIGTERCCDVGAVGVCGCERVCVVAMVVLVMLVMLAILVILPTLVRCTV